MTIDVLTNESKHLGVPMLNLSPSRLPVKRSLFGNVNHEECMDFLNKELNQIAEEKNKKWNFDFVNEKPLEDSSSSYEWTAVQADEVIPKAYAFGRLPYLGTGSNHVNMNSSSEQDNLYAIEQNNICRTSKELESRLGNRVTVSEAKLTQKSIDGYMKSRKRISSNEFSKFEKKNSPCSKIKFKFDNYCESDECNQCYHTSLAEPSHKKLHLSPP